MAAGDSLTPKPRAFRPLDLSQARPDLKTYPDCPAMPDAKRLTAHGVAIRPTRTPGLFTYYTVTHGFPFESVQVFALDARGAVPELHWTGCVQVPDNLRGNGVTAAMDGTIYNSVQLKNGATQADYFVGKVTGGLYQMEAQRQDLAPAARHRVRGQQWRRDLQG